MIKRGISAGVRAVAVATLLVGPALILNPVGADSTQMVGFVALLAGALIFVEYVSTYPSVIDFRGAPPFNRLRFAGLAICVLALTVLVIDLKIGQRGPVTSLAFSLAMVLDFPFSPVRLLTLVPLPESSEAVRLAASVAYAAGLATVAGFVFITRVLDWPLNRGNFNVLTNMPLFDPTSGGDVLDRMRRDAQFYLSLGFLLPFLVPALMRLATPFVNLLSLSEPQMMIWIVALWAFIPASMAMRGLALLRVAALIAQKRRRAYAERAEDGFQAA